MTYDRIEDDGFSSSYFKKGEPDPTTKSGYWKAAFGLQKVDGLAPSSEPMGAGRTYLSWADANNLADFLSRVWATHPFHAWQHAHRCGLYGTLPARAWR